MEVILRDHVEHLGERGEIVKVADGYARNFLLPRKLALPATDANKNWVARERKIVEAKEAEEREAAQAVATRLEALDLTITRKVGENDQLYGSVTNADIARGRWRRRASSSIAGRSCCPTRSRCSARSPCP